MRDFRLVERDGAAARRQQRDIERRGRPTDRAGERESANDLQFSQLKIPFTQEDWVITIDDAALRGASIGATASGTINLPGGKMAISGAFIPAFGLNNIAGGIPILGGLFGGRNEGLVRRHLPAVRAARRSRSSR